MARQTHRTIVANKVGSTGVFFNCVVLFFSFCIGRDFGRRQAFCWPGRFLSI